MPAFFRPGSCPFWRQKRYPYTKPILEPETGLLYEAHSGARKSPAVTHAAAPPAGMRQHKSAACRSRKGACMRRCMCRKRDMPHARRRVPHGQPGTSGTGSFQTAWMVIRLRAQTNPRPVRGMKKRRRNQNMRAERRDAGSSGSAAPCCTVRRHAARRCAGKIREIPCARSTQDPGTMLQIRHQNSPYTDRFWTRAAWCSAMQHGNGPKTAARVAPHAALMKHRRPAPAAA